MTSISDSAAESILADLREAERVKKLSDMELIHEVLKTQAGDIVAVQELLNRFYPEWSDVEPE